MPRDSPATLGVPRNRSPRWSTTGRLPLRARPRSRHPTSGHAHPSEPTPHWSTRTPNLRCPARSRSDRDIDFEADLQDQTPWTAWAHCKLPPVNGTSASGCARQASRSKRRTSSPSCRAISAPLSASPPRGVAKADDLPEPNLAGEHDGRGQLAPALTQFLGDRAEKNKVNPPLRMARSPPFMADPGRCVPRTWCCRRRCQRAVPASR